MLCIRKLILPHSNHTEGHLFHALGSLRTVQWVEFHSISTVSFPCHVIPVSSIMWVHNALIGLFNPIKPAGCLTITSCFINIYVFVGVSVVTLGVLWFCLPPYFDVFTASVVPVNLPESKKYLIKEDALQCSVVFKWCCKNLLFITSAYLANDEAFNFQIFIVLLVQCN